MYALNVLLEGLSLRFSDESWDAGGYALVDIAEYFQTHPLEARDVPEHLLKKVNLPDNELLNKLNGAIEAYFLNEIANSLKYLRKRYYCKSNDKD